MSQNLDELKVELTEKLVANLDKGIENLLSVVKPGEKKNFLIEQKSRIGDIAKHYEGLITYDNYSTQKNQIQNVLIRFIDLLHEDDLTYCYSELGKAISKLKVKAMRPINLVDCDRIKESSFFWKKFDLLGFRQFYFLPGCPNQQPDDLAERIIWEIIRDVLEDDVEGAISFELEEKQTSGRPVKRIQFWDIPAFTSERQITLEIKKHLKNRFYLSDEEFQNLNDSEYLTSSYRYAIFVPRIIEWTELTPVFFDKIFETFEQIKTNKTTFIFFFVIESTEYHCTPDAEIEKLIEELLSKYESCTSLIGNFNPIKINDVSKWFKQRGVRDDVQLDIVIDLFKQKNNILDSNHDIDILKMCHAQKLQEITFDIYHNS